MKGRLINKSNDSKLKSDLSHIAQLYVYSFLPPKIDIETHRELQNFHKNGDIVTLKPDKVDYIKGINDIISDKHKVTELSNDTHINREDSLQHFLWDLKKKGTIDKDVYNSFYPPGSQTVLVYGLIKCIK